MVLVKRSTCPKLGRWHRAHCTWCKGSGVAEVTTELKAIEIGPGWFDSAGHQLSYEMRHDVAMLASALGSRAWPPEV